MYISSEDHQNYRKMLLQRAVGEDRFREHVDYFCIFRVRVDHTVRISSTHHAKMVQEILSILQQVYE